MLSQESSSSYYLEQFRQPSIEEKFLSLNEEIKKDKDALEMRLPIMKTKMDANMIANINTNLINLSREMYAIMGRTTLQAGELEKVLKEKSSRQLSNNTKNDDIRESEDITLSLKDELLSLTLDEHKEIMECDKMPLVLKGEFQVSSLVENNELAIEVELVLKTMQIEEQHLWMKIENVLVGVEDFNFPIVFNF